MKPPLPFVMQAVLIMFFETFPSFEIEGRVFDYGTLVVSATAGFAFIARSFGKYATVVAVLYFPIMMVVMYFYSFVFVGAVYGRFL